MTPRALAPIILFAYHRPAHAARTLQTLQANRLAADSRLYVFCDGPPPDASAELRQQIARLHEWHRREGHDLDAGQRLQLVVQDV